jgi:hypothetical protein
VTGLEHIMHDQFIPIETGSIKRKVIQVDKFGETACGGKNGEAQYSPLAPPRLKNHIWT